MRLVRRRIGCLCTVGAVRVGAKGRASTSGTAPVNQVDDQPINRDCELGEKDVERGVVAVVAESGGRAVLRRREEQGNRGRAATSESWAFGVWRLLEWHLGVARSAGSGVCVCVCVCGDWACLIL